MENYQIEKFKTSDWDLLFDSRYKDFKGKLQTRWLGPYEVVTLYDNGRVKLHTIDDDQISFMANGHHLKLYQKHMSKEAFIQALVQKSELNMSLAP
jgi:hypothetical protein